MPSHNRNAKRQSGSEKTVASKNLDPFPENFGPIFFQNQFRTKIELPTKQKWPGVNGKCAIITGSNTGLGFESSKQLLGLGLSHLIMGVRSLDRGKAAADKLRAKSGARIDVWHLDMESYDSIQRFVRKCQESLQQIDIVILNAGIAPTDFNVVPATGHEKSIQVNHISTALLTILLLPVLKAKAGGPEPPVLTVVNSLTAQLSKFTNRTQRPLLASFDDTAVTPWDSQDRYGVSKLLSQLFLVELSGKVSPNEVIINMVEPGLTKGTGLGRDASGLLVVGLKAFLAIAGRPLDRAAATYVDAVLGHGKECHGCYLMNCEIAPLARWYYSDGKALTEAIWNETLQELAFAGVDEIIASFSSRSLP